MEGGQDGLLLVRADLASRVARLRPHRNLRSARALAAGVADIARIAADFGLAPVVDLAGAFERSLRRHPRLCPSRLFLERLADAIGCRQLDRQASAALIASIAVRLDG